MQTVPAVKVVNLHKGDDSNHPDPDTLPMGSKDGPRRPPSAGSGDRPRLARLVHLRDEASGRSRPDLAVRLKRDQPPRRRRARLPVCRGDCGTLAVAS
jgi:hypothetical protein